MFPILKSSDNLFNHEIEISAWNAKKQRQITEREIELLLNRISLLKKEDEKTTKKISLMKKKTDVLMAFKMD